MKLLFNSAMQSNFYISCMQELPVQSYGKGRIFKSIHLISCNRVVDRSHMASDLVLSSCFNDHLKECVLMKPLHHFILCDGLSGTVGSFFSCSIGFLFTWIGRRSSNQG